MVSRAKLAEMKGKLPWGWSSRVARETGLSDSAVRQVMRGVFYNQAVIDSVRAVIDEEGERDAKLLGLVESLLTSERTFACRDPRRVESSEAAEILNVGVEHVRRLYRQGVLKGRKKGRKILFTLAEIERYRKT